jgi:chromosome segregation ATPase
MCAVRQAAVRRKVQDLQARVVSLRAELAVLDEQIEHLDAEVEDLRVRAVVSETPLAVKEHAEAARHAELAHRARQDSLEQLARAEEERDRLLDEIAVEAGS